MDMWVIWSEEHGMWWGPGRMGYTPSLRLAGRYSATAAAQIVADANITGEINEVMFPDLFPRV